jgi:iron transport multicopper oxidase
VDSLQIYAGQRYSFILNANQPVDNYWIRAKPSVGTPGFDGGINSAILRYAGANVAEPTTVQAASVAPLKETALHPVANIPVPGSPVVGGADVVMNLLFSFDFANHKFLVNGATFVPPTVPVLLQILSGAQRAQDLLPAGSVYPLPKGKVVELSMPSGVLGGHHPFHLHGHNFHVIRSAGSPEYNFINPPIRDVVNIGGSGDNVTVRFVTDNAGPWMLHCHIDWHQQAGLAIVFAEDIKGTVAKSKNPGFPDAWRELCPIYNSLDPSQL